MTQQADLPSPTSSLRGKLLWRLLAVIFAIFLARLCITVTIDYVYANRAFDRSLLDEIYALAGNVGSADGKPLLELSEREVATVLFSDSEKAFYALFDAQGQLIAGDALLQLAKPRDGQPYQFVDAYRGADAVRVLSLYRERPVPYYLVVGQTLSAFKASVREQVVISAALQLLLLAALGFWLRRSIDRELQPLIGLQEELDQRDPSDLQPVTPIQSPSDLQRLARTINGLFQRIAATGQSQREFAGTVAHELRTPLAGIRSLADYGLRQTDPQAWRQQLERIRQSEQRASHLVHQLLALAQADELQPGASLQVLDVSELVRDLLLRQMARAQSQGADLGGEGLDTVHRALVDASLLEGLLTNLVDNALRYGRPADGTAPQVTVAVFALQDQVVITVEDNGPGLAADELEQVLQRGRRGKAGDALGIGAGLGLSIAQRYAQLLKASMHFDRGADGRGLCVRILLPAAAD